MNLPQRMTKYHEELRIKKHLLGARKLFRLNSQKFESKTKREKRDLIERNLKRYTNRGEFPKNTDLDYRAPYIKDNSGTLCAMAYLIDETGDKDLVDELDQQGRNKYIREFETKNLGIWLEEHGMLPQEAERIQPMYQPISESEMVSVNSVKMLIMSVQIIVLSISILFYQIRFRDTQVMFKSQQPSLQKTSGLGLILLLISFYAPLFKYKNYGPGSEFGYLWIISSEITQPLMVTIVLLLTAIFYLYGVRGNYIRPELTLYIVIANLVYLISITYYYLTGTITVESGIIRIEEPLYLSTGYFLFLLHVVVLIGTWLSTYFFNKN